MAPCGGEGAALVLRDVRFGYARRREVLHGVSARMPSGQLTAIVGPNGCGKTTLVKCVARILVGTDHRYSIPASVLFGAVLMLAADTLARTLFAPTELPVGIVTSFVGVPFFLYLILRRRRV